ncbi:hypothetical protein GWK47_031825 [Chionoecetes opilio]|uniref:Uncharacterized protein n=1 Tax=Chionoecetes opilio TaxID=41210 RepID=A0A8J5D4P5_CHIOP|nr:hypothetical protein GWK47_031825 [Chionoecetes opilio]
MTSIKGIVLLWLHWVQVSADKIECYSDVDGSKDDPNNIYNCNKAEKCCHESGLPSCCTEKPTEVAVWEQVQLWGTLVALIIILALLVWYWRHDGNYCSNEKGEQCSCCRRSEDDSHITEGTAGPEDEKQLEYQEVE